ncbi:MAG: energy-coupling factor transporter transmembrane component T family protein [Actinomycetales bacterium]
MSASGLDRAGLFWPGRSVLHRMPGGAKLTLLAAGSLALVVWRGLVALAVAGAVVAAAYAVARIPVRVAWAQLRPLRWVVLVLGVAQLLLSGWRPAVAVVGALVVLVAAAALLTLTTRVSTLVDTFTRLARPLRRAGVDPDRIGLLAALTVRTVPVIAGIRDEVDQARRARGLERSPRALLVPLVVRTVRHADHLGEALVARGVDD